jgi:hypothetical protein
LFRRASRPSQCNPFHWALEFPEVFSVTEDAYPQSANSNPKSKGFDAIVGNPPFIGGKKITGALGTLSLNIMLADKGGRSIGLLLLAS